MAVETLRPNAAGDECTINRDSGASCPNHYQNVDEASADDNVTYVRTDTGGWQRDLYNIDDHSVGSGIINKITVYARCRFAFGTDKPALKIAIKAGQGAGAPDTVSESSIININSSYTDYSNEWATNPKTSAAWTWDEIDNLQAGVNLLGIDGDDCYCTQLYVEVDYIDIIEKVSSDSGAGSEARGSGSPLASFSQSDSGSGTEGTPLQAAVLSGLETGSGMEAILSLSRKLISDAGSGAENSQLTIITATKISSDAGSGAETAGLLAEFERDEAGNGTESLLSRLLHNPDSGWGNDAVLNRLAALSGVDTGSGTDLLLTRLLEAGETGLGTDKLLSREISLNDAGSGAEATTIYKILLATDGGGGLDALSGLLALITSSESGYSSEKLGAKIMTSPGAGDMKLPTKMGKVGIPRN